VATGDERRVACATIAATPMSTASEPLANASLLEKRPAPRAGAAGGVLT